MKHSYKCVAGSLIVAIVASIVIAVGINVFKQQHYQAEVVTNELKTKSVQTQSSDAFSTTSAAVPTLFVNYDIVFGGGASSSTSVSAIRYRLNNTYIKNKVTGTTTPYV